MILDLDKVEEELNVVLHCEPGCYPANDEQLLSSWAQDYGERLIAAVRSLTPPPPTSNSTDDPAEVNFWKVWERISKAVAEKVR